MSLNHYLKNVLIPFDGDESIAERIRQFVGIDPAAQNAIAIRMQPIDEHAETIIAMAEDYQSDFIVMALHEANAADEHSSAHHPVTVCEEVALTAGIPVMLVRPEALTAATISSAITRIVVPIDGSMVSGEIVPVATMLSNQFGAPVHLITVIDPLATLPAAYAYLPESNSDRQDALITLQREANRHLDAVERMLGLTGVEVTSELVLGATVECLLGAIKSSDIVAMTTHGEGNASRSRFGSMALHLLRQSPVPVVVLLPSASCAVGRRVRATWDTGVQGQQRFTPAISTPR